MKKSSPNQSRDLKNCSIEYVGEPSLSPFITYTDMKNIYPIQVIASRAQVD